MPERDILTSKPISKACLQAKAPLSDQFSLFKPPRVAEHYSRYSPSGGNTGARLPALAAGALFTVMI